MANEVKEKTSSPKRVKQKTKIEKIEQKYGKSDSTVSLDDASKRLKDIGFISLGKILKTAQ